MTSFRNLHQPTTRIIENNKQDFLFFGGTAYLGLLGNQHYIELFKEGIDHYGLNNGTSRSNNVQLGIYNQAEEDLASRFGFESAALLSSGYLAAQVAVRSLCSSKKVCYAPDSHPSLWINGDPGVKESFSEWSSKLVDEINQSTESEFVIISNALDNLTPKSYDFTIFKNVEKTKQLLLILDDSHGIGIVRKHGVSLDLESIRDANIQVVLLASLAKGLGTDSGVVLGESKPIAQVKKHPIFSGASPGSPAALYAMIRGKDVYEAAFENLHKNTQLLAANTADLELGRIKDFPVFTANLPALSSRLLARGIVISSFPYPLSSSPLLNRVVVTAEHTEEDILKVATALQTEIY